MKIFKATLLCLIPLIIAIATGFSLPLAGAAGYSVKDITLQPGSNETMMNFCWQSASGGVAVVQVAQETTTDASAFPVGSTTYSGSVSASTKGYYSNQVTVTDLAPQTTYLYRVGNGTAYSAVFSFKTGNRTAYNTIFVSDAQIGASGSVSADKAAWEKSLSAALAMYPSTSFLLSAGDQVDYYLESEYDAFLAAPLLRQYPLAPAIGNHENLAKSPLHAHYYNEPNASAVYGLTPAGGNYWFSYGSTLYLVLNTNNTSVPEHDAFMAQAIAANPEMTWTILMFHQSVYSSAEYASASSIMTLRKKLVPVIDKHDIDVVLSGHDHCYTRTYQMLSGSPVNAQSDSQGRLVNPVGTVYITANSSSGSKYYDMKKTPEAYAAVRLQPKVPTFTNIEFSDHTLTMTTYRTDTLEVLDTYAIIKQSTSGFVDVPTGAWYAPAVTYLTAHQITDGTSKTAFSPDMVLTRGQCLVLLMRAYGISPDSSSTDNFSDAGTTWYTGYLAAAKHLGLAGGTGNNKYLPEASVSRQDMFVLIYNTLVFLDKLPTGDAARLYTDTNAITPYAKNAIEALSSSGIITGNDGQVNPSGLSTRAQMAQVLYKLLPAG